jgi:hypothetical protein
MIRRYGQLTGYPFQNHLDFLDYLALAFNFVSKKFKFSLFFF